MTEDRYEELTRRHDHSLERLAAYEGAQKGNRRWLMTAILTALGGLGGTGGLAYFDSAGKDNDNVQTAVATHVALDAQWKEGADEDLDDLTEKQDKLREAVRNLQFAVKSLNEKHRGSDALRHDLIEVEALLQSIGRSGRRRKRSLIPPGAVDVQQYKDDLFSD